MLKKMTIPLVLFFLFHMFFGCSPKVFKTELDELFENDFEGLNIPENAQIKKEGINKSFPYATFDKVWDSAIIVLMQQRIIVRASKDTGKIVTVSGTPIIILVERSEPVSIYFDCMYYLNKQINNPKAVMPMIEPDFKEKTGKAFFDKVATQVYADEKWKYLYKVEK